MITDIAEIKGRRVWDSRGRPTVEAEIHLSGGAVGRAMAPAGASTGSGEAVDLRDGGTSVGGHDVRTAVASIAEISTALRGCDAADQERIDHALIALDGTANKRRLGGNATVAVSMAVAHAAAAAAALPLWAYLAGDLRNLALPLPEIQIFGGGAHAGRRVDVQDFMVIAVGAENYVQALDWTAEVYRAAAAVMDEAGLLRGVADEGGYWPAFDSNEQGLDFLVRAIERAGLQPGADVAISLDIAATDFATRGRYRLARDGIDVDSDGLTEMLLGWLERYPIVAIEDPLAEDDLDGMVKFTAVVGDRVEVVADDFVCTQAARIETAAAHGACNTALIKPNQAGTLTEARAALAAARTAGWQSIVSARSGETEDVTIVHLAVGWGVKQLKVGSFARSERMAKWNEGLRIAEALDNTGGTLAPRALFPWAGV
ncbi:MAG: phosphopyruvate hydratase [Gammaproteobacteria bacterium]|nr:phosphopyruvate hydratase [Gammaproteobacteria bacterium]